MEYMLLIYVEGEPGSGTQEEQEQMGAAFAKYSQDLVEAGAMVGGDPLQPPTAATTVRAQGGETVTSDGPFAETKEWLGGYYKIDVETLDEAIEWAGRVPSVAFGGSIEVRPLAPMPTGAPSTT
jgi:hypothetical protein